jgi:carbamoyl-phosphate synthase large subunit
MTLRVAITGVSGDVGRGAIKGLQQNPASEEQIWLLGFDASSCPPCLPLLDQFVQLPRVTEANYIDAMVEALRAHHVDVVLAGIDAEIGILSAARDRLACSGANVILASEELVDAANDKLLTAKFLSARGILVPETCDAQSPVDIDLPLVAKPRRGHGSAGVLILSNTNDLQSFLARCPHDYCLQRQIVGPELTVGFLYDRTGVMRDAIAMERTLKDGRTVRATVVDKPVVNDFIEEFGRKVVAVGAINVQLRWDERVGPMIFEINARLSGSTDMRIAVGFNDPLRLVRHFGRGTAIVPAKPQRATIHRLGTTLRVEQ